MSDIGKNKYAKLKIKLYLLQGSIGYSVYYTPVRRRQLPTFPFSFAKQLSLEKTLIFFS